MTGSLADEILRRLIEAGGKPLSGQRLATDLGVTRTAVWKAVISLRDQGCRIASVPSHGYALSSSPGDLRPGEIAARLRTRRLGHPVRHFARIDSTNREAERWVQQGAPEGAVVVADHQESGRGRLGRSWHGLPGKSLLFSLVLRPNLLPPTAPLLTFVASVALAETVASWVAPASIEIKWPNDLLLNGRKAAGILLEMRTEGQRVDSVILGVGINVQGDPADFPEELRETATTVEDLAGEGSPDRLTFLCRFLEVFEGAYELFSTEGFGPLSARWNRWFRMAGKPVRVRTASGIVEGLAKPLGAAGALVLEQGSGSVAEIYAGDVELATSRVS